MKASVRMASPADTDTYLEYTKSTKDNLFDPEIASYPSLRTLAVDVDGKPSLYVPFHPILVIESLSHRPDTTLRENAYAIKKAGDLVEEVAQHYGMAEVWWMCKDESLIKAAQHHGYELVKTPVLRKKVLSGVRNA